MNKVAKYIQAAASKEYSEDIKDWNPTRFYNEQQISNLKEMMIPHSKELKQLAEKVLKIIVKQHPKAANQLKVIISFEAQSWKPEVFVQATILVPPRNNLVDIQAIYEPKNESSNLFNFKGFSVNRSLYSIDGIEMHKNKYTANEIAKALLEESNSGLIKLEEGKRVENLFRKK